MYPGIGNTVRQEGEERKKKGGSTGGCDYSQPGPGGNKRFTRGVKRPLDVRKKYVKMKGQRGGGREGKSPQGRKGDGEGRCEEGSKNF